jgi:hypothetical protein
MAGEFDDVFYRNKRAALASSFLLILANWLSVHSSDNVTIYNFSFDSISHRTVISVGLLVCLYLNVAYLLHYLTEVPAWRRAPETGLQEVVNLRTSLTESIAQSKTEREEIIAAQKDMSNHLEVLSNSLHSFVATDFPQKLEKAVLAALNNGMGEIKISVFNQLSAAIRKDSEIAFRGKDHLKWDVLTGQIIDRVSEKIVGTFEDQYQRVLGSCRNEILRHMEVTGEGLDRLKYKEEARLESLKVLSDKNFETEKSLRSWSSAMNWRLRAHYFYLPIALFICAAGWSLIALLRPFFASL